MKSPPLAFDVLQSAASERRRNCHCQTSNQRVKSVHIEPPTNPTLACSSEIQVIFT